VTAVSPRHPHTSQRDFSEKIRPTCLDSEALQDQRSHLTEGRVPALDRGLPDPGHDIGGLQPASQHKSRPNRHHRQAYPKSHQVLVRHAAKIVRPFGPPALKCHSNVLQPPGRASCNVSELAPGRRLR